MTIGEAYFSFLSKTNLINMPELAPETYRIEYFFNEAIKILIAKYLPIADSNDEGRNFFKYLKKGFEADLSILSSIKMLENSVNVFLDIKTEILNVLLEVADINNDTVTFNNVGVKPVKYDEYLINIKNPFKCPYEELIWRVIMDGNHVLILPKGYTIKSYSLAYISPHKNFSLSNMDDTIDIGELFHEELVDTAIKIAFPQNVAQKESKVENKQ